MSDGDLAGYSQKIMADLKISKRSELSKHDGGLYACLSRRNLLDRIFPVSAKKSESELLAQLKDAVELYLGKP